MLRDLPTSRIALAGLAIILIAFVYYFSGWPLPWRFAAQNVQAGGAGGGTAEKADPNAHYLGSIILSPRRGDKCWERMLDNRNGTMWDKGYVECDVVPPLRKLQDEAKGLAARRLKAIGNAFAPKGN